MGTAWRIGTEAPSRGADDLTGGRWIEARRTGRVGDVVGFPRACLVALALPDDADTAFRVPAPSFWSVAQAIARIRDLLPDFAGRGRELWACLPVIPAYAPERASPGYLAEHGVPASPDRLQRLLMVGFVSSLTGQKLPLKFTVDGRTVEVMLPARVLAGRVNMSIAAARSSLGLVQAPRHRFEDGLASGALVEVLADFRRASTPLSVLYPSNRQLSPRVRVFVDWLFDTIGPRL